MRHGFSFVELLIALALGLVIMFTAVAGFRVASQSVATVNRLSLENGLMRAGLLAAVNEVDFWTLADHPSDADRQKLRAAGLPFVPVLFPPTASTSGAEASTGWGADEAWASGDPRTWYHGNCAEGWNTDRRFGHYELFTAARGSADVPGFGLCTPAHHWYPDTLQALRTRLGYYGLLDHLPCNAIYGLYDDRLYQERPSPDGLRPCPPEMWTKPGTSFANGDGGTDTPRGIYRLTKDSVFAVVPATAWNAWGTNANHLVAKHAKRYNVDAYSYDSGDVADLLEQAYVDRPQLRSRPAHWPDLRVGTMRFVSHNKFTTLCKVRWSSPVTGETTELSFTTLGTTLRGARRQHRLEATSAGTSP